MDREVMPYRQFKMENLVLRFRFRIVSDHNEDFAQITVPEEWPQVRWAEISSQESVIQRERKLNIRRKKPF